MQLPDSGPKGLRVTCTIGQLDEEIFLGLADSINNGIAKRSIFDKPVMAFRMFESMVEGSTFLDGRSDFMVNPRSVGIDRYSFTRDTAMHGTHKNRGPFTGQRKVLQQPLPQLDVGGLVIHTRLDGCLGDRERKGSMIRIRREL